MVGVSSYGVHIPVWRIKRELLGKGLPGERAVAGKDEDSLTMAVAAALDCLEGVNGGSIDGIFFASTTPPFYEKSVSATIAAVLDARREVFTADFSGSLRAGTTALKVALEMVRAGSADRILVAAADCRLGAPGTPLEQTFGDGAAALLVERDAKIADVEFAVHVYDEIYDIWRRDVDLFVNSWEDRYVYTCGYMRVVKETISRLMDKSGLNLKDVAKVVLPVPESRRGIELAKSLGLDPKTQLQDSLMEVVGNTGTAQPLMLFAAALEEANPNDWILMASYGSGGDAFLFKVKENLKMPSLGKKKIAQKIANKKTLPDYITYLKWRKLVKTPEPRVDMTVSYPSAVAIWRETHRIYPLHGVKCKICGTVQYPPQRVCVKCQSKDNFEEVRLCDKKGRLFSYSFDPIRENTPVGLINLEGGGRVFLDLTDVDAEELKIDMPVKLTFRRVDLRREDGMYVYFWKATPIRE